MRVVQINANADFGSTGLVVQGIHECLKNNGYESLIVYQRAKTPPENGYKVGSAIDWKCHALRTRLFGHYGFYSKRPTRRLLKYLDEVKPDIVHFHNLHSNFINIKLLCEYLADHDIPTIITLHDCWFFTGKCTHYAAVKCDKWQSTCGNCPQNKNEQASLFIDCTQKVLKDRTDHLNKIQNLTLVGCSKWITNEAKKSLIKNANFEVAYNGVDTSIFTPHNSDFKEKYNLNKSFTILGFANKWCLDINKSVTKEIIEQNSDADIILVGCTDEQEAMFSSYENVTCIGYVNDRQKMADIYASSDVFVNLTHADTLPTVNMESICCGTPVITYNCCGSPELVDKDSGFIVEEDDVESLLLRIQQINEQPLVFNVKEKQAKFDKNICYKKYLDIYLNYQKDKF
jgi:glycosyltransferase involved in cell wall biosynthesis